MYTSSSEYFQYCIYLYYLGLYTTVGYIATWWSLFPFRNETLPSSDSCEVHILPYCHCENHKSFSWKRLTKK